MAKVMGRALQALVLDDGVIAQVVGDGLAAGALSELTALRTGEILMRLSWFLRASAGSVVDLGQVRSTVIQQFVDAPYSTSSGLRKPGAATRNGRRTAVRLLFRWLRRNGLIERDPSLELTAPARPDRVPRPLTDSEVDGCRSAASTCGDGARAAAIWALAEATARSTEIAWVLRRDVVDGTVRLAGGTKVDGREALLGAWGRAQVERWLRELGPTNEAELLFGGRYSSLGSRYSAVSATLSGILRRAGVSSPEVRPLSVAGWAGRRIWLETGRIELAAAALGMHSLDRAARLVGWDWRVSRTEAAADA